MSNIIRVVGLDPSFRNFGMVSGLLNLDTLNFTPDRVSLVSTTVDKSAKKSVRKNSQDLLRATQLFLRLHDFIKDARLIFVEIPVGSQSARAMTSYGVCIGLLSSIRAIPLLQVTPNEVKKIACNKITATKTEMIQWARSIYPQFDWFTHKSNGQVHYTESKNEHIVDAIAAIHAGISTDQFKQLQSVITGIF